MFLRTLLLASSIAASSSALAINKCESGGNITYTDAPCANAKQLDEKVTVSSKDAAQAAQRAKQEKAELHRLEVANQKADAKADKDRLQNARAKDRHAKACDLLALRKKFREDAVATAAPKSTAKARIKARQAGERYDLECAKSAKPTMQIIG